MKTIQLFSWAATITLVSGSVLARNIQDTPRLIRRQGKSCNRDNCLRNLLEPGYTASANAFCATYTTAVVTEPTAIPAFINKCGGSPGRVSSACSCLASPSSSATSAPQVTSGTTAKTTTSQSSGVSTTTNPQNPGVSTTTQSQSSGVTTTTTPSVSSSTTGSPPTNSSPLTPGCKFGPKARGCWNKDFNIDSDPEERWPNTGKTVYYELEIMNTTLAPDGVPKQMLVVNGQYPGPMISAQWGDRLEVKVTNKMQNNGTSIHWHGFRQLNSNIEDGVDAVTECPIAPGESKTYKFQATQHGTSWYHSHFTNQYGDGVLGPIVIEGPATANYDHDLGPFPITDHYYDSMYKTSLDSRDKRPFNTDNGLIKGKNKSPDKTAGSYQTEFLFPGKRYRMRLINTGVVNSLTVHLDGHKLEVIAADMVPVVPYETDWLNIHIGQRYDVIITASLKPGNFWFRVAAPDECSLMANNRGILAIINIGAKVGEPTGTAEYPVDCTDEKRNVPHIVHAVPRDQFSVSGHGNLTSTLDEAKLNVWTINGTGIKLDPSKPTLEFIAKDDFSYRQNPNLAIYDLLVPDAWMFLLIQNTYEVPHPLHLHGHDAYVLGSSYGPGVFSDESISALNFDNPTRRDTYMLPGVGWVVIAFKADNPGAWLFHCHIVWHTPEGMAIQFMERPDEIKQRMSLDVIAPECASWAKWFATSLYPIEPPKAEDE